MITRFSKHSRSVRLGSPRRRGYSAVELIVAIVISMVVAIMGISGLRIFNKSLPVKSTARRLSHTMSTARSFAISENAFYQVVVDLDQRQFWIDEIQDPNDFDPDFDPDPKIVTPEHIDERVEVFGIRFGDASNPLVNTGPQVFVFNPDGSCEQDVRVYFNQIGDDPAIDNNIHSVRLYAPTGASKVFNFTRI